MNKPGNPPACVGDRVTLADGTHGIVRAQSQTCSDVEVTNPDAAVRVILVQQTHTLTVRGQEVA